MIDRIEERPDVGVEHPTEALIAQLVQTVESGVDAGSRPVRITRAVEDRIPFRAEPLSDRRLRNPIDY